MGHRISTEAERDLDEIWLYVASQSGSVEIADRIVDTLTDRLFLLSSHPHIGRDRSRDLQQGLRTFPAGDYVIFYRIEDGDILVLRVIHGSRDIPALI